MMVAYEAGLDTPPIPAAPTTLTRAEADGAVDTRTMRVSTPESWSLPGQETAAYAGAASAVALTGPTSARTAPAAVDAPKRAAATTPIAAMPAAGTNFLTGAPESHDDEAPASRIP
jgi:hypothetical protein